MAWCRWCLESASAKARPGMTKRPGDRRETALCLCKDTKKPRKAFEPHESTTWETGTLECLNHNQLGAWRGPGRKVGLGLLGVTRPGGTRDRTTEVDRVSPWETVLILSQLYALGPSVARLTQLSLHPFLEPTLSPASLVQGHFYKTHSQGVSLSHCIDQLWYEISQIHIAKCKCNGKLA